MAPAPQSNRSAAIVWVMTGGCGGLGPRPGLRKCCRPLRRAAPFEKPRHPSAPGIPLVVGGIAATVVTAVGMFAVTNIDDAVVLAVLNIAHRSGGAPTRAAIWAGQFIGIGLMIAVSLLAALGLSFVPLKWVGLIGLIPLIRGILLLVNAVRPQPPAVTDRVLATGTWSVIAVTFANGGDNIALYTPAFRVMGPANTALTVAVFAAATALWCIGAEQLISHHKLVELLKDASRWLVPAVLMSLGVYILARSGLLATLV